MTILIAPKCPLFHTHTRKHKDAHMMRIDVATPFIWPLSILFFVTQAPHWVIILYLLRAQYKYVFLGGFGRERVRVFVLRT